jgi:hypothetical protein
LVGREEKLAEEIQNDTSVDTNVKASLEVGLRIAHNAQILAEDIKTPPSVAVENLYYSHTRGNLVNLSKELGSALESLDKGRFKSKYKRKRVKAKLEDRLITHIFRPDIFMVPPPTCNVIFPDQYSSVTFSRNWMSEVSRLWLHGKTSRGRDLKKMYFAPNADMLSGPTSKDAASAARLGQNFLMKHEKFTGIVPSIEGIGDMEIFSKINKATEKKDGTTPWGPTRHMQRAAHYLFFKYRYMERVMNISGTFMPNLVPGLPGLLLDPIISNTQLASSNAGTHFLGMIESVTHTIGQGGAVTRTSWSHCRPYNEALDLNDDAQVRRKSFTRKKISAPVKGQWVLEYLGEDSFGNPIAGFSGREARSGEALKVALQLQLGDDPQAEQKYPELFDTRTEVKAIPRVKQTLSGTGGAVAITEESPGEGTRPDYFRKDLARQLDNTAPVPAATGDQDENYLLAPAEPWMANEVVEGVVVDVYAKTRSVVTKKTSYVAFEDGARPPWFSSIYLNSFIGEKFYNELLGCPSIVDNIFLDPGDSQDNEEAVVVVESAPGGNKEESEFVIPREVLASATILDATNALVDVYRDIAGSNKSNVGDFIKRYTRRDFASCKDMFGDFPSQLLQFDKYVDPSEPSHFDVPEVQRDTGFHAKAFGDLTNLEGLDHEPLAKAGGGKFRTVSGSVDPRAERYAAVLSYRNKISSSRGHRG